MPKFRSQEVISDCEAAVEVLEDCGYGAEWRRRWVTVVALLRAVGHVLHKVVKASGRYTFGVWFGNERSPVDPSSRPFGGGGEAEKPCYRPRMGVEESLSGGRGLQTEAQAVADFLFERQEAGELIYETGQSA